MKHYVRTINQAFAYIADCNLATVCSMAMTKSRRKGEYERQISIAQSQIDWMKEFDVDPGSTRAEDIIKAGISVGEWAKGYEPCNPGTTGEMRWAGKKITS
jgi:hypothetical protein